MSQACGNIASESLNVNRADLPGSDPKGIRPLTTIFKIHINKSISGGFVFLTRRLGAQGSSVRLVHD